MSAIKPVTSVFSSRRLRMKTGCRIRPEDLSIGLVILRFRTETKRCILSPCIFISGRNTAEVKKVRRLRIRALSSCGKDERDRRYGTDGVSASASAVFPPSHISIQIIRRRTAMRTDIYPSYNICVFICEGIAEEWFRIEPHPDDTAKRTRCETESVCCRKLRMLFFQKEQNG